MEITTVQFITLRTLLEKFVDSAELQDAEVTLTYKYLFDRDIELSVFNNQDLLEAARYLKLILDEEQISNVIDLSNYYEERLSNLSLKLDQLRQIIPNSSTEDNHQSGEYIIWKKGKELCLKDRDKDQMPLPLVRTYNQMYSLKSSNNSIFRNRNTKIWSIFHFDLENEGLYNSKLKNRFLKNALYFFPTNYLKQFSSNGQNGTIFCGNSSRYELSHYQKPSAYMSFAGDTNINRTRVSEGIFSSFRDYFELLCVELFDVINLETPISNIRVKKGLTQLIFGLKFFVHCSININFYDLEINCNSIMADNLFRLVDEKDWKQSMVSRFEQYYETKLRDKDWEILKSPPGSSWLTSDNPGFIVPLKGIGTNAPTPIVAENLQKIDNDTELYYPLSNKYCLHVHPRKEKELKKKSKRPIIFVESTEEVLVTVNKNTVLTHSHIVVAGDKATIEQFQR